MNIYNAVFGRNNIMIHKYSQNSFTQASMTLVQSNLTLTAYQN